jgi:microsomal epoxide hydrolase
MSTDRGALTMSHKLPARFNATIPISHFTVSIPDSEVDDMKTLVKLSKLPRPTYEGRFRNFGVTGDWMKDAKEMWENDYDWHILPLNHGIVIMHANRFHRRVTEAKINSLPQYLATVGDQTIHFVGVFSDDPSAVPLLLLHGWPGSFFEFYPLIKELKKNTTPSFHIIAPSFPGYMFSSPPPLEHDYRQIDAANTLDALMNGLGLGPYVAVGGNMGAQAARGLTSRDSCRGCHRKASLVPPCRSILISMHPSDTVTMFLPHATPRADTSELPEHESAGIQRGKEWLEKSRAYLMLHGTRPSTISHVVASNPLALLAWIGEKFLDWTDEDPSVEFVLEMASLWWLTGCYPSTVYPYREFISMTQEWKEQWRIKKPFGFSWFPKEVTSMLPYPANSELTPYSSSWFRNRRVGSREKGI